MKRIDAVDAILPAILRGVRRLLLVVTTLTGIVPSDGLLAQSHSRVWTIAVGALSFDSRGTGTTYTVAARASQPLLGSWLAAELGLGYAPLNEQFSSTSTRTGNADLQVQFRAKTLRLHPYLGFGPGMLTYLSGAAGRKRIEAALSSGVGIRILLGSHSAAVVDARYRGWDLSTGGGAPVNGSVEVTLGIGRRF